MQNKSAKMQQYVKQVEQSVNKSSGKAQKQQEEKKKAKEAAEQAKSEIMPATIKQAKVPEGMQPDEVVCEFWRHGWYVQACMLPFLDQCRSTNMPLKFFLTSLSVQLRQRLQMQICA